MEKVATKSRKTVLTDFQARAINLLVTKSRRASDFASVVWPNSQQVVEVNGATKTLHGRTISKYAIPGIKGAVHLNRLAKLGLVYRRKRVWHPTELGINHLCQFLLDKNFEINHVPYTGRRNR